MSLRIKTFLVLVATLIGVLLAFQFSFQVYLETQVKRQEAAFFQRDLQRAISILEDNLSTLDITLHDYAEWDDTYDFVHGVNPDYLETNLVPQKFDALRLNLMVIIRADGKLLYGQGYDLQKHRMALLPSSFLQYLGPNSALLMPQLPDEGLRTILALNDGPLLLVARPIQTSYGDGEPAGTMLMGRFLDETDLARLKQLTLMDISLYSSIAATPPVIQQQWLNLAGKPYYAGGSWLSVTAPQIQTLNEQNAGIYALTTGVFHQPLLIEVVAPRTFYLHNLETRRQMNLSILLVGVLLLVVTHTMLDRAGLRNLYRLNTAVADITAREDVSARVPVFGSGQKNGRLAGDEVSALAAGVNDMLSALETGQRRRIEDEMRYRAVIEQAFEGIFLVETETLRVIEANPAFQKLLGYSLEELQGMTLYDLSVHARTAIQHDIQKVIEGGHAGIGERGYNRKDGQRVIAEVSGSLLRFGDRSVICSLVRDVTERKREDQAAQVLNQISQMAASEMDFQATMQLLVDRLGSLMESDACYITLWDEERQLATPVAAYGPERDTYANSGSQPGELSLTSSVMASERTLVIADAYHSPYIAPEIAKEYDTWSLLGLPLVAGDEKIGALLVGYSHGHQFTPEEVARAERAAGPTALAVAKAQLFEDLKRSHASLKEAYDITLEGWARALELRDQETEGHTRRVTALTLRLGQAMGINGEALATLQRGALLHDIGKMGIPDSILLKPGALTPAERQVINRHPEYAYTMLAPIDYLRPALEIPYRHHEKWDGSGYPRGLSGMDIPLEARIFAVVDVWDALTSDRPYRKAWPPEQALEYIREQSGKHFDPAVVEVFLALLRTVYGEDYQPVAAELQMGD